jgi:predicted small metal-binding protein
MRRFGDPDSLAAGDSGEPVSAAAALASAVRRCAGHVDGRTAHAYSRVTREEGDVSKKVDCPCGETMRGDDDDELVTNVEAHVRDEHPEMAGTMSREQILGMASED